MLTSLSLSLSLSLFLSLSLCYIISNTKLTVCKQESVLKPTCKSYGGSFGDGDWIVISPNISFVPCLAIYV